MTIGSASYGSLTDIEALTRVYTNDGKFDASSNPARTQVESFVDQVSALVNVSLAAQGFAVPVTNATAKRAIDSIVNQLVSDLAHAANSSGRFFTERSLTGGLSIWAQIRRDIEDWVVQSAGGFSALGVSRQTESQLTVGFRDGDDNGDPVSPLFGRDQYGSDIA
jgi:hypothetical protein